MTPLTSILSIKVVDRGNVRSQIPNIGQISIVFNSRQILPQNQALQQIFSKKLVSRSIEVTVKVRFAFERHHMTLMVSYYYQLTQNLMHIKVYNTDYFRKKIRKLLCLQIFKTTVVLI